MTDIAKTPGPKRRRKTGPLAPPPAERAAPVFVIANPEIEVTDEEVDDWLMYFLPAARRRLARDAQYGACRAA